MRPPGAGSGKPRRALQRLLLEDETEAAPGSLLTRFYNRLNTRTRFFIFAILFAVMATAVVTYIERRLNGGDVSAADPTNIAQTSFGASLYAQQCAGCHGQDLAGQAGWDGDHPTGNRPAAPLAGDSPIWRLTDTDIFNVIKYGGQAFSPDNYKNNMPGYAEQFADGDIWAVVAFIKSRWSERLLKQQETAAEAAEKS